MAFIFLKDIRWLLGGKLTALRPFHPKRTSGSSSQGQILILGMDLLFLSEESLIDTTI